MTSKEANCLEKLFLLLKSTSTISLFYYLFANFKTIPFRGAPPVSLLDPWSVTSLTVHSFFSLLASEAGLANGEHIGLPGDEAEGDAGTEDAGVGSGVGSLSEEKSDSDNKSND